MRLIRSRGTLLKVSSRQGHVEVIADDASHHAAVRGYMDHAFELFIDKLEEINV